MAQNIQIRRDLSSQWSLVNPLLLEGEFAIETDTKKFKLGDGVNHWNTLPYGGPQGVTPPALIAELAWDDSFPTNYSELTYNGGGLLTQLDVWESNLKVTHLFSKVFSYTSGKLSSVQVTRVQTGSKIVKTISYNAGKVSAVTRVYTP